MLLHGIRVDENLTLLVVSDLHNPNSAEALIANRRRAQVILDLEKTESFIATIEEILELLRLQYAGQPSERLDELKKKLGLVGDPFAANVRTIYCVGDPLLDDTD